MLRGFKGGNRIPPNPLNEKGFMFFSFTLTSLKTYTFPNQLLNLELTLNFHLESPIPWKCERGGEIINVYTVVRHDFYSAVKKILQLVGIGLIGARKIGRDFVCVC